MYGQTESSPVITMSSVEDSLELRVSTVGGACPNTEVKDRIGERARRSRLESRASFARAAIW